MRREMHNMPSHTVFISIGSNLGDRLANCCKGIAALCADETVRLIARSPFYETEPVDYVDQAWFLNAAMQVSTRLSPEALLDRTQAVQRALGRAGGGVRFGPRVLDLDIIFFDRVVIESPRLILPHPRMHKRRFVLQPICDIDGSIVHPVLGRTVESLLNQLVEEGQSIKPCSFDC